MQADTTPPADSDVRVRSPLFTEENEKGDVIYADQIRFIKLSRYMLVGGKMKRVKVPKEEYRMADGTLFSINPFETTEDDLEDQFGGGEYYIEAHGMDNAILPCAHNLTLPGPTLEERAARQDEEDGGDAEEQGDEDGDEDDGDEDGQGEEEENEQPRRATQVPQAQWIMTPNGPMMMGPTMTSLPNMPGMPQGVPGAATMYPGFQPQPPQPPPPAPRDPAVDHLMEEVAQLRRLNTELTQKWQEQPKEALTMATHFAGVMANAAKQDPEEARRQAEAIQAVRRETEELRVAHRAELQRRDDEARKAYDTYNTELHDIRKRNERELEEARKKAERENDEYRKKAERENDDLRRRYDDDIKKRDRELDELRGLYRADLERRVKENDELRARHDRELHDLRMSHEKTVSDLRREIDKLASEGRTRIDREVSETKARVDKEWRDRYEKSEKDVTRLEKEIHDLRTENLSLSKEKLTLEVQRDNAPEDRGSIQVPTPEGAPWWMKFMAENAGSIAEAAKTIFSAPPVDPAQMQAMQAMQAQQMQPMQPAPQPVPYAPPAPQPMPYVPPVPQVQPVARPAPQPMPAPAPAAPPPVQNVAPPQPEPVRAAPAPVEPVSAEPAPDMDGEEEEIPEAEFEPVERTAAEVVAEVVPETAPPARVVAVSRGPAVVDIRDVVTTAARPAAAVSAVAS